MTLVEAWQRLREAPGDGEAWAELERLSREVSGWRGVVAEHRDDARQRALGQLARRFKDGDAPPLAGEAVVRTYVGRSVVRSSIDLHRKAKRQARVAQAADAPRPQEPGPPEVEEGAWADLDTLAAAATRARQEAYRPHLQRAWSQVRELHLTPITLRELVARDEHIPAHDAPALEAAVARAYKAHERMRGDLLDALNRKRRDWGEDRTAAALTAIGLLRRRRPTEAGVRSNRGGASGGG